MLFLPTVYFLYLPEAVHYHLHAYCDAHTAYLRNSLNICLKFGVNYLTSSGDKKLPLAGVTLWP